ncbi:MAG: hypothetical protein ACPG05_03115 [Bdellovibrionales bacterium]
MIPCGVTTHPQTAWVVFSDETDLWRLRFLKRGFRHCYVLFADGDKWCSIDPLSHVTEIGFHQFSTTFNLPLWLKSQGHVVVQVSMKEAAARPAPLMLMSCVEAVKRLLGIHNRWVITPWQLYRHLLKCDGYKKQKGDSYGKSCIQA